MPRLKSMKLKGDERKEAIAHFDKLAQYSIITPEFRIQLQASIDGLPIPDHVGGQLSQETAQELDKSLRYLEDSGYVSVAWGNVRRTSPSKLNCMVDVRKP